MATYLQGVTDYIPKIQPFTPDFNFYATALQTLQTKYDTNYKQLSQYYGRLLRSPMLRDDNIEKRKQFETAIMNDIKKISGLDLSLQQNVDAATQILDPLVNDKGIINDIVKTRQWQDARTTGENLSNTEWGWQGGMKALDYWAQDFRSVSKDDALNFQKAEYVPYINVYQEAIDDAKANKWEVKQDNLSPDGKFIVTNKNGDMIAPTLRDYFIGRFGRDPQVMKFFNTEAYVERKDYINANKDRFNGNEAEAQMEYAKAKLDMSVKAIKEAKIDAKQKQEMIDNYNDLYEDYIRTNGILPTDSKTINQGKALQQAKQNTANTSAVVSDHAKTLEIYQRDYQDFLNNGLKLDQIISYNNMYKIFDAAAKGYANLTAEFTIKGENPYALEQVKASNALALEGVKHQYKMEEIEHEQKLKTEAARKEKGVDAATQMQEVDLPGTATDMNTSGMKENLKKHNEFYTEQSVKKSAFLADVSRDLVNQYNAPGTTDAQKKGIADTLKSVFGRTNTVNVDRLLNSATSQGEIDKIKATTLSSNPQLFNMYTDMTKYMDMVGNPLNQFNTKYSGQKNQIKRDDQGLAEFTKQRLDQRDRILVPYFSEKENDPTGMVSLILKQSSTGFWPDLQKEKIISSLVKANRERYGEDTIYNEKYFRENWGKAKKVFYDSFSKIPQLEAWNHLAGTAGVGSNAKATKGTQGMFDYSDRSESSTTMVVEDIFRDVQKGMNMRPNIADVPEGSELANAGMGAVLVDYGDGSTQVKVSNAAAAAELKAIMADRLKGGTGKFNKLTGEYEYGDDVLGGSFTYANIAQGDPNYIQFTITPSARYAASTQQYKDVPGYISGKQITVRIPTNIAQNILYKQSQTTLNEYLYDKSGSLTGSSDSGTYTISNTSTGPAVKFNYQLWDPNTGKVKNEVFEKSFTPNYNIDSIDSEFQRMLNFLDDQNFKARTSAAEKQGLTGDAAVNAFNQMLNGQQQ